MMALKSCSQNNSFRSVCHSWLWTMGILESVLGATTRPQAWEDCSPGTWPKVDCMLKPAPPTAKRPGLVSGESWGLTVSHCFHVASLHTKYFFYFRHRIKSEISQKQVPFVSLKNVAEETGWKTAIKQMN